MSGAMWYNMGCFCTGLGRFAEAMRYLNRAVDAGHADPAKYLRDPDLAPLHARRLQAAAAVIAELLSVCCRGGERGASAP